MRVSRAIAEKNREKVVETAGRLFRERGYEGIGIADLMKAASLTHGGFYKQFDGKAALISEATRAALAENKKRWMQVAADADGDPAAALRCWYLSAQHLAMRGEGCCLAALAAEAPRQGTQLQKAFAGAVHDFAGLLGGDRAPAGEALRTLSMMVGALVLARAIGEDPLSEGILEAVRNTTDERTDHEHDRKRRKRERNVGTKVRPQ